MYYNFEPITTKKIKKRQRADSLSIDNRVIEYTFTKTRSKTPLEIKMEICCKKNSFLVPTSTLVSVYIDTAKLQYAKYDANTNTMIIAGHFSVSYRNMHTQQETSRQYNDDVYCISFPFKFKDIDRFLEIVNDICPNPNYAIPVIPLSL